MAAPALALRSLAEQVRTEVDAFVRTARQPRILESGEPAYQITPDTLSLEPRGRWLTLEASDGERFLSRRIVKIKERTRDRLELVTEKFGGREGSLVVFDAARPANEGIQQKGRRQVFGSTIRTFLQREFPGWRIVEFSTDANLEASLSPSYPRALLRKGTKAMAAIAAPPRSDVDGALTFGLIWLDYLRRREPTLTVEGLAIFVPEGSERNVCLRLRWLNPKAATWLLYNYDSLDHSSRVDPDDWGNIGTNLDHVPKAPPSVPRLEPEAILEDQVRNQLGRLDARLLPSPVYGQVPNFAGCDRGILDLLAVAYDGRLTVIELKATESIQLPLQALDYWIRVNWHLVRNDFSKQGYFPGTELSQRPPRLLLAAPALRFHPTTELLLSYFHPEIEVESVGLAAEWTGPIRVLFRHTAGRPIQ